MAEVNIYYHKQTNSWWINKEIDGFSLRNYINKNPIGLGTIEYDTQDKREISDLYEVSSTFIPDYIKKLNNITEEIEKNGFKNGIQVMRE